MHNSNYLLAVILVAGLLAATACSQREDEQSSGVTLADGHQISADQVAPFSHDELPSIEGNEMHEMHFAAGSECGECHLSDQPMPVSAAHDVCEQCHPGREVSAQVWKNHCLSCHHFTISAQKNMDNPELMMEDLCAECHTEHAEGGGHLEAFFAHEHDEMVKCDHCHRPHEANAPAAIDLCTECHDDLNGARHPRGSTANCGICHRPHRPRPAGSDVCISCHGQAEDVMVHNLPDHPANCLVCHEPHFTTIEIKGICSDCHDDMPDFSGVNQPQAHLDCASCHVLETFAYKGSYSCAGCHPEAGAVLSNDFAPGQHKTCATCHPAHSWSASRNCRRCHDNVSDVLAHDLEFHSSTSCLQCHDVHLTESMPTSTDCMACHEDTSALPSFGISPPEMHLQCANCHAENEISAGSFGFVGEDYSCVYCHADAGNSHAWGDVPGGHTSCLNCHTAHSFAPVASEDSCEMCHASVVSTVTNEMHRDCLYCHSGAHDWPFAGSADSCATCHMDKAKAAPNSLHGECSTCHSMDHEYSFIGESETCEICHARQYDEAPAIMHQDCSKCHSDDHSFGFVGVGNSCQICHSGMGFEHAAAGHADCSICHTLHTFTANYGACLMCHSDKTDGHFDGFACATCHKFKPGGVFTEDMHLVTDVKRGDN